MMYAETFRWVLEDHILIPLDVRVQISLSISFRWMCECRSLSLDTAASPSLQLIAP